VLAVLALFGLINFPDALLLVRTYQLGLSTPAVIAAYALYNFTYAAASYPAGALADRIPHRLVFALGLVFFAVGYLGLALIHTPWLVYPPQPRRTREGTARRGRRGGALRGRGGSPVAQDCIGPPQWSPVRTRPVYRNPPGRDHRVALEAAESEHQGDHHRSTAATAPLGARLRGCARVRREVSQDRTV
jgi:hypothetical protein